MTKPVKFDVTREEQRIIAQIAARAVALSHRFGRPVPQLDFSMDITATHKNGNPLRLSDLLAADEMDFAHDVFGIRRHLNRETGKLENSFTPRYSVPVQAWPRSAARKKGDS